MSLTRAWGASALLLACCTAAWADGPAVVEGPASGPEGCAACAAGGCATGACGLKGFCCPKTCFTLEKAPCIKFKHVCPKPVCEPCNLQDFGYYATCWRPWPYPPNCAHCPAPPPGVPASQVPPAPAPGGSPEEPPPPPIKGANPSPYR
jgi:hypothetical protein